MTINEALTSKAESFKWERFTNKFIWKRNSSSKTEKDKFTVNTEYVYLYSKSKKYKLNNAYKPLADSTKKMYSKDDKDGRGKYRLYPLQKPKDPGPETTYDYVDNTGKIWKCPPKGWRMTYDKLKALENDNRLYLEADSLNEKAYWNERTNEGKRIDTLWNDLPENTAGSKELERIFGNKDIFDNPKPVEFIKRCLEISNKNAIVLDFFAGSGTTGQAVMQLNAEDGGNRKYIMVQLPEEVDEKSEAYKFLKENNKPTNICEIGKERIRRAGEKIKSDETLPAENREKLDIGFKVIKL